jgi:hypothetical protein
MYILYTFSDHTFLQIHISWLWMHPKAQFYFFAMGHFDWPFKKIMILWYSLNIFYQYRTTYGGVFSKNILNAYFAPNHCLSTTFIIIVIIYMSNIQ